MFQILRHQFGTKRVRANEVYQEVIKDKGHVHMNSTVWHTLTGFVMYLRSSGKCKIDQGEKGWYIQYIDQEDELRRNKILQRAKKEKDEEERNSELLERQINRALEKEKEAGTAEEEPIQREMIRENDDEKIKISLAPKTILKNDNEKQDLTPAAKIFDTSKERETTKRPSSSKSGASGAKKSTLDKIMEEEERYKERKNRKDHWLHEGIIVKVVTKKLGSEYYKAKGRVVGLVDKYTAKVEVDGGL